MPKENKQRGRRGANKEKRKRTDEEDDRHHTKRQKPADAEEEMQFLGTENTDLIEGEAQGPNPTERPFFGLLDEEEQEYFRRADELLELNDFPSDEERDLFLANVYKEAEGKELKLANSQSSSRLMERLIMLSTPDQMKNLFAKFSGHFLHLLQHRFASHCCETLFIRSAPVVTQELVGDVPIPEVENEGNKNGEDVYVSMENLFLYTLNELEGHLGFLLTDKYASHALRVLLVVLSGQPLAKSSTKSTLQSKKKETISINGVDSSKAEFSLKKRAVPESFDFAVNKIISDTVAGLDTSFIQVLATHPTGNPTLQVVLEMELTRQGTKKTSPDSLTIIQKLLPDDLSQPDSKSASFINGLMYEPIGSRLLETIVTFAPGKLFKQIYRVAFKERMGSLARNEIASFVVIKVLERLSQEDLEEAVGSILPQIPGLIERSRTTVIKTLLERCHIRNATNSISLLTQSISESYGSDPSTLLLKMTHFAPQPRSPPTENEPQKPTRSDPSTLHGSLLAQSMFYIPGPPTTLIQTSLLTLSPTTILHLACTTTTSHILQAALLPIPTNLSFRKKLITKFLPDPEPEPTSHSPPPLPAENQTPPPHHPILTLALSPAGSHTLDALNTTTSTPPSLLYLKERICTLLADHQKPLKEDFTGRVVLRNWAVELFCRRRGEWIRRVKESPLPSYQQGSFPGKKDQDKDTARSQAVGLANAGPGKETQTVKRDVGKEPVPGHKNRGKGNDTRGNGKTAIELARLKFAQGKVKKELRRSGKVTGANAI